VQEKEVRCFIVHPIVFVTVSQMTELYLLMILQSEVYEAELTCMGIMRSETKLLVGSSKGTLYLFNWGEFGYHSDEFPGPKHAINYLLPVTENIAVCAADDGVLR
jgi:hypothetical protein